MRKVAGLHLWTVDLHNCGVDLLVTTSTENIIRAIQKAEKALAKLRRQQPDTYHRNVRIKGCSYQGILDA